VGSTESFGGVRLKISARDQTAFGLMRVNLVQSHCGGMGEREKPTV